MNTAEPKEIQEQQKIYESIFHNSTDGILIIEDGLFVECNAAAVKMLEYKNKQDLLNLHPSQLSPEYQPDGRSSFEKAEENTKVVLEEGSRSFDWVHKKSDGSELWLGVVLTNISIEGITRFIVVWRDIDARKQMEEDLKIFNHDLENEVYKRTEALEKALVLLSDYVIYSRTDVNGLIIEVSNAFCEISGYKRAELLGSNHRLIKHPDMPDIIFKDLWSSLKSGSAWYGDIKNLRKDGTYYWVDSVITPEFDSQAIVQSYISIRHDITAKVDLQGMNANLEQIVKDEVESNRQKDQRIFESEKMVQMGEMIGNIAHQWRQPLASISSVVSSLAVKQELGTLKDADIAIHVEKVIDYVQYLSETINTFRNFLKDDKAIKEIVLQKEIKTTLFIIEATLKDNQIKYFADLDEEHPILRTMVTGELAQVLINIISNASDVLLETKTLNPWIKLTLEKVDEVAVLTIEDNGGGISDSVLPKIFDPYFTTKHQSHGTGLGLHMSYQIVTESLKGRLYAENTDNGAKFFIELPL